MSGIVRLSAGGLAVQLAPEVGGSVFDFRIRRGEDWVNLLRPATDTAHERRDPTGTAMFPMIPYANRIAGNRFDFEGRAYLFDPNLAGERFNLHGSAWQSKWTTVRAGPDSAELGLDRLASAEPFSYFAFERFVLTPEHLEVTLQVTNRGERAMPFGLGLHPCWEQERDVTLQFRASHVWLEGPDHLATDRITVPTEWQFSTAKALPQTWRNNCYSGWDGKAVVAFPSRGVGLRIEADEVFGHLMLYCDPDKPAFCLEPQTHAVGALNRLGVGDQRDDLVILNTGESMSGTVSFTPFSLGLPPLSQHSKSID